MNFQLDYWGTDGDLSAELMCGTTVIAETDGLVDKKAAYKWADRIARDHRIANTPETTHRHLIEGGKTFTL